MSRRITPMALAIVALGCGRGTRFTSVAESANPPTESPGGSTGGSTIPNSSDGMAGGADSTDSTTDGPSAGSPGAPSPDDASPDGGDEGADLPSDDGQPPPQVRFGASEDGSFHLGNGEFSNSSCKNRLLVSDLSGVEFDFVFRVLSAGMVERIDIKDVCGIDLPLQNGAGTAPVVSEIMSKAQLLDASGKVLAKIEVTTANNSTGAMLANGVELAPGLYRLRISAGSFRTTRGSDVDDFMVGEVSVRGTFSATRVDIETR